MRHLIMPLLAASRPIRSALAICGYAGGKDRSAGGELPFSPANYGHAWSLRLADSKITTAGSPTVRGKAADDLK